MGWITVKPEQVEGTEWDGDLSTWRYVLGIGVN
jgi:hypothetical protein